MSPGPEGELQHQTMTLYHLSPEGELSDTLGEFPHAAVATWSYGNMRSVGPPRFSPRTQVTASDSGTWVATGRHPGVELVDAGGRIVRSTRWRADPEPITTEGIRAHQARLLEETEIERREEARQRLERAPYAAENAYSAFVEVDPEGNLWVMRARGPLDEGPSSWMVFEPSGRLLGDVELPEGFQVKEIGADYVLGVRRDELDVEHVQLLPIVKDEG